MLLLINNLINLTIDFINAFMSTIYILVISIIITTLLGSCLSYLKTNSYHRLEPEDRNPSTTEILQLERKKSVLHIKLQKPNPISNSTATSMMMQMIILTLTRGQVLEDTMRYLMPYTGRRLLTHRKLKIKFKNEEGIDAGGLTREWFMEISKEVFDTKLPLFIISESDRSTLSLNPLYCRPYSLFTLTSSFLSLFSFSNTNANSNDATKKSVIKLAPSHLKYYKTFGIVMGKAVYESQLLNISFSNLFLKLLFGRSIEESDIIEDDPQFYSNLLSLQSMSIDSLGLDLTFTAVEKVVDGGGGGGGGGEVVELISNGQKIPVTDNNKTEYIQAMLRYKYQSRLIPFIKEIQSGFEEIMPISHLNEFSIRELQILFNGLPFIDIRDWRTHTRYAGYSESSQVIIWFWDIIRIFSDEERCKLLQFVTASSRVPPLGFRNLQGSDGVHPFTISRLRREGSVSYQHFLPQAHTCFNMLCLPDYESYDVTKRMLLIAINECEMFTQN